MVYPRRPRWHHPVAGAWMAVLVALLFAPGDSFWLPAAGLAVLSLGLCYPGLRNRRGARPTGHTPRELGGAMAAYHVGVVILAVGVSLVALHWYWIGVAGMFVLATVGGASYERVSAAAAHRAGRGASTTYRATSTGRRAYAAHRKALQALRHDSPET